MKSGDWKAVQSEAMANRAADGSTLNVGIGINGHEEKVVSHDRDLPNIFAHTAGGGDASSGTLRGGSPTHDASFARSEEAWRRLCPLRPLVSLSQARRSQNSSRRRTARPPGFLMHRPPLPASNRRPFPDPELQHHSCWLSKTAKPVGGNHDGLRGLEKPDRNGAEVQDRGMAFGCLQKVERHRVDARNPRAPPSGVRTLVTASLG